MEPVTPVNIVGTDKTIPITIIEEKQADSKLVTKESGQTLAPKTTEQQDIITAGQRRINLIWENTQRIIAIFSVFSGIIINAVVIVVIMSVVNELTVNQLAVISMCLQFINLTAGIVIGFYFSRTNHQKIGGVAEGDEGR
jgi:nucleoside phosphorylase